MSSSHYGVGSAHGSLRTPLGKHAIAEKIGAGAPPGTVFKGRQPSSARLLVADWSSPHGEDMILSRILWLQGLQTGINSGSGVDSKERYIYIHGTHQEHLIGHPASIGCIRMRNSEVIELFDAVRVGTGVWISGD